MACSTLRWPDPTDANAYLMAVCTRWASFEGLPHRSRSYGRELVSEFVLLRFQVLPRGFRGRNFEWDGLGDRQAVALQADELPRVVRQQPHRPDAEVAENLRADAVIALVRLEAEAFVGAHGFEPLVPRLVRADLVGEADAAPFLVQVQQDAAPFRGDTRHRRLELRAAVAARGVKDVAGQALRMHPDEHVLALADVAAHQRDVGHVVDGVLVGEDLEVAVLGWQLRVRGTLDETLGPHPVLDQIGDRDHRHRVLAGELRQLRHTGHRAVLVHDFADDACRIQAGHPREVDGRLRLTGADHHAAVARAKRRHVAGTGEVRRSGLPVDRRQHGRLAIGRGDAGAGGLQIDRHAERRAEGRRIRADRQREVELVEAGAGHREADLPAPQLRPGVDRRGPDLPGGKRYVALCFAVLVLAHAAHLAPADGVDRLLDRGKRRPLAGALRD